MAEQLLLEFHVCYALRNDEPWQILPASTHDNLYDALKALLNECGRIGLYVQLVDSQGDVHYEEKIAETTIITHRIDNHKEEQER